MSARHSAPTSSAIAAKPAQSVDDRVAEKIGQIVADEDLVDPRRDVGLADHLDEALRVREPARDLRADLVPAIVEERQEQPGVGVFVQRDFRPSDLLNIATGAGRRQPFDALTEPG